MWLSSFLSMNYCLFVCGKRAPISSEIHRVDDYLVVWLSINKAPCHNDIRFTVLVVYLGNDWCSIRDCWGAIKLKFLTERTCGRGEIIGADEWCWFGDRFERAWNFAILNQIIIIFLRTQTLDWDLNLLCVYLSHAKDLAQKYFQ